MDINEIVEKAATILRGVSAWAHIPVPSLVIDDEPRLAAVDVFRREVHLNAAWVASRRWTDKVTYTWLLASLSHEIGHLLRPDLGGHHAEHQADAFAASVLAWQDIEPESFALFLMPMPESETHPDGFDRFHRIYNRWALRKFFPDSP